MSVVIKSRMFVSTGLSVSRYSHLVKVGRVRPGKPQPRRLVSKGTPLRLAGTDGPYLYRVAVSHIIPPQHFGDGRVELLAPPNLVEALEQVFGPCARSFRTLQVVEHLSPMHHHDAVAQMRSGAGGGMFFAARSDWKWARNFSRGSRPIPLRTSKLTKRLRSPAANIRHVALLTSRLSP